MNGILVVNKTRYFHRPRVLYALADMPLRKPLEIFKILVQLIFFLIWSVPIVMIFGFIPNPFYAAVVLGPPIGLGYIANKPIFGGKTAVGFAKSLVRFLRESRCYADLRAAPSKEEEYYLEQEIWISRRSELFELYRQTRKS